MESEDVVVRRVTRRVSRYLVELQAMQEALERARESALPASATPNTAASSLGSEAPHFEFADEVPTLVARARGDTPKQSEDTGSSVVPPVVIDEGSQETAEQLDQAAPRDTEERDSAVAPVLLVPPPPPVSQGPEHDAASAGIVLAPGTPLLADQRDRARGELEAPPKPIAPRGLNEPRPPLGLGTPGSDTDARSRESKRAGGALAKGTKTKPNTAAKVAAASPKIPSPPPVPPSVVPASRLAAPSSAPPSSSPALSEWSQAGTHSRWSPPLLLALIIGMSIALAGLVYFLLTFNKYVY